MDQVEFGKAAVAAARVSACLLSHSGVHRRARLCVEAGADLPVLSRPVRFVVRTFLLSVAVQCIYYLFILIPLPSYGSEGL